ncbi:MAG: 2-C-methyl-D-erythritol 4-phosphate cytidylyltransferase [Actinomycetota bacterium]|nr:2-C-methyl-D-erythritol 4-phosphate cytidylyltransferase [Actinomycetota bacterium]
MAVALIVAAGSGERLGASRPKAFVTLAGKPMVQWSVDAFRSWDVIDDIVVALPPGRKRAPKGTIGVPGGKSRSESVKRALAAAPYRPPPEVRVTAGHVKTPHARLRRPDADGLARPYSEYVFVHDAARPLITIELLQILSVCKDDADAVTAGSRIADTVRRTDASGLVTEVIDRQGLWAVETPQVFHRSILRQALDARVGVLRDATDETSLVQRIGGTVAVVSSGTVMPTGNLKVTWPSDLRLAELILRDRA